MEAISTHALCIKMRRDCVVVGNGTVAAMEGGIEASNLRQIWKPGQQSADGLQDY